MHTLLTQYIGQPAKTHHSATTSKDWLQQTELERDGNVQRTLSRTNRRPGQGLQPPGGPVEGDSQGQNTN